MAMTPDGLLQQLPAHALEQVASYFRTLSEATRLRILSTLRSGALSVGEIAEQVESSPANVSRHLLQLAQQGLVSRESRGNSVYYSVSDPSIYALCDLVCNNIARQWEAREQDRAAFEQVRQGTAPRGPGDKA